MQSLRTLLDKVALMARKAKNLADAVPDNFDDESLVKTTFQQLLEFVAQHDFAQGFPTLQSMMVTLYGTMADGFPASTQELIQQFSSLAPMMVDIGICIFGAALAFYESCDLDAAKIGGHGESQQACARSLEGICGAIVVFVEQPVPCTSDSDEIKRGLASWRASCALFDACMNARAKLQSPDVADQMKLKLVRKVRDAWALLRGSDGSNMYGQAPRLGYPHRSDLYWHSIGCIAVLASG
jgi:hypothetical protein